MYLFWKFGEDQWSKLWDNWFPRGPLKKKTSTSVGTTDTHADPTSIRRAIFHERRIISGSTVYGVFIVQCARTPIHRRSYVRQPKSAGYARLLPVLFIIRLCRAGRFAGRFWASSGAKFPKMGDSKTQNLTPLALSTAEKSVTIQTNKQKHTNRKRYIKSTPCLSVCVYKKNISITRRSLKKIIERLLEILEIQISFESKQHY